MKYLLGGSYIIMKSTPRVLGGEPKMAIGYIYNYRKVLVIIDTEEDGIT